MWLFCFRVTNFLFILKICVGFEALVMETTKFESKEGVYIIQGDALTGERIDCSQKGGQIAEESRGCLNIVPTAGLFHTQLAAYLAIYKASNVPGI
jgi:hypothetical protein